MWEPGAIFATHRPLSGNLGADRPDLARKLQAKVGYQRSGILVVTGEQKGMETWPG